MLTVINCNKLLNKMHNCLETSDTEKNLYIFIYKRPQQ